MQRELQSEQSEEVTNQCTSPEEATRYTHHAFTCHLFAHCIDPHIAIYRHITQIVSLLVRQIIRCIHNGIQLFH